MQQTIAAVNTQAIHTPTTTLCSGMKASIHKTITHHHKNGLGFGRYLNEDNTMIPEAHQYQYRFFPVST